MEEKKVGNELVTQNRYLEAVEEYTKGIDRLEAEDASVTEEDNKCLHLLYGNRSLAYRHLVLLEEALQDACCAIETKPDYGKGYARRAAVFVHMFQYKDVLADLRTAEDLDPSLAPSLEEYRQIATGKKWVPNCYLNQQVEFQKNPDCLYLLRLDHKGERLEAPVWSENMMSRVGFQRVWQEAYSTGEPIKVYSLSSTLRQAQFQTPLTAQVGGPENFKTLLHEQLKREFGELPSRTTIIQQHADHPNFQGGLTRRVHLATCMRNNKDPGKGPCFYPGAPQWTQITRRFREVLVHEMPQAGIPELAELEQEATRFLEYRAKFPATGQGQSKCQFCKIVMTDSDPPECLCGVVYCSDVCHKADWENHAAKCRVFAARNPQWISLVHYYWKSVWHGYFPFKDEPDWHAHWEAAERNGTYFLNKTVEEAKFCSTVEGPYLQKEMLIAGTEFSAMMCGKYTDGDLDAFCPNDELACMQLINVIMLQQMRLLKPLFTDSPARLMFKMRRFDDFYATIASFKAKGHGVPSLPPREALNKEFEAALAERVRQDQLSQAGDSTASRTRLQRVPYSGPLFDIEKMNGKKLRKELKDRGVTDTRECATSADLRKLLTRIRDECETIDTAEDRGMPPGMAEAMQDPTTHAMMQDPEYMEMINDPEVMTKVMQVQSNPMIGMELMNDPKMGPFLQKFMARPPFGYEQ